MNILAIETSCDETSVAIIQGDLSKQQLLAHLIFSQIQTHTQYGGVIPEVAARLHVPKILPLIDSTLKKADLTKTDIDAIAVTAGPGLVSSLMVGVHTARMLSHFWQKPLIAVHHIEGHIMSGLMYHDLTSIKFPALCLIISGGHTELIHMEELGSYKIIGKTRDDAVGEAFDKVAKLLGLPYPGGPNISKLALESKTPIKFTQPMQKSGDLDFSYSGLKTAVAYHVKQNPPIKQTEKADIASGFEQVAIQSLIDKTISALKKNPFYKSLLIGGGVCANKYLREQLSITIKNHSESIKLYIPEKEFCTDNAGMIALCGLIKAHNGEFIKPDIIRADPIWELGSELSPERI